MSKVSLEKRFDDGTITEEDRKKYALKILIQKLVLEAVYIIIVTVSLVKFNRNVLFFSILGNTYKIYIVAMVIFYVAMYFIIVYNTFLLGYMAWCRFKKKEWLPFLHKMNSALDLYTYVAKCLSILLFIMIYVTTPCTIVGDSMKNTFYDGEKVMCSDVFYTPKVDDVIIFNAQNYTSSECFYIKRIVAVEGDTIATNGIYVSINDVVYEDIRASQYAVLRKSAGIEDETITSFAVPKKMVMVMGDNRDHSTDSRVFGLIHNEDIFGKVYLRIYPFSSISINFERKEV